jgi:uncharacterized membrane protein YgdD (TMEM256/DUF423 family)
MNKRIILTAAFLGVLAVILGAFGAHSLKDQLDEKSLAVWQKGVEYQFYHVFALLYLSTFARYKNKLIKLSYIFFSLGIVLFSGSLYAITIAKNCKYFIVNTWPNYANWRTLFYIGMGFLVFSSIKR